MFQLKNLFPIKSLGRCLATGLVLVAFGCGSDVGINGSPDAGPLPPPPPPPPDAPPGPSLTDGVVEAIGGADALTSLTGFELVASGSRSIAGEGLNAGDPAAQTSTFDTTVAYEVTSGNLRVDYDRTIGFLGDLNLVYAEVYNGDLGFVDGRDSLFGVPGSQTAMLSARWASGHKQNKLLNPHILLRDVLDGNLSATEKDSIMEGNDTFSVLEIEDAVSPIQLLINEDGTIAEARTLVNDFLLRDSDLVVTYTNWQNFGTNVMFPEMVSITLGPDVIHDETRTAASVNPTFPAGSFDIPGTLNPAPVFSMVDAVFGEETFNFFQAFAGLGITLDFQQTNIMATEIATGVWHVTGGSHHSLAVEQDNSVVIVEAPNAPERSDAILAWAATEFPGKAVSHVVMTHHHEDHSAGLRTFVSAGAEVVMQSRSQNFFRDEVFTAPSTVVPDTLSTTPMDPSFITVPGGGSALIQQDGNTTNPVEVYHLINPHSNDMLLIYVPLPGGGGIAFQSDLYNPGAGGASLNPAFAQALLDSINTVGGGLDVTMLAGGHGGVAPLQELIDFINSPPPPPFAP